MKVSVIISTYNSVEWLEKVLWGFSCQDYQNFEIIIADDGSGPETADVINRFQKTTSLEIRHVWQEHSGYGKTAILNKAILNSSTEYLIFADGDCIPRKDFISIHYNNAEKGYFLSGGCCRLPMDLSKMISKESILNQQSFDPQWLRKYGSIGIPESRKLAVSRKWGRVLDYITTSRPSFNGGNTSAWKADIIEVNGFDERMQYGGLDREIGERLKNYGIKGKQIRHRAIVLHLDHPRNYKTKESIQKNLMIRKTNRITKIKWTPYGIVKKLPAFIMLVQEYLNQADALL